LVINRSTRTLSNTAKDRLVLSESELKESQRPMKMLAEAGLAPVIEAIFSPEMYQSIVLPVLLMITSRQTKPIVPTASPPVCCV